MKRLILSILIVSVLILAACATSTTTPATTTTPTKTTTTSSVTTTTAPATTTETTTTTTTTTATTPPTTTTTTQPATTLASIKIEVTATAWQGEPFDIYTAIEEQLVNCGIKVISEAGEPCDATLSVEYEETKGSSYAIGEGTNIDCSLALRDNENNILLEQTISGRPGLLGTLQEGETLYSKALDDFQSQLYFKYLSDLIAAKLGFGDEVAVLVSALEDEYEGVRKDAAAALGELGDESTVEALSQVLLNDESEDVREGALLALGEIGNEEAVEALIQALLNDESSSIRVRAAKTLGKIGDASAVEALCYALLNDENLEVQQYSAKALGDIGDESAIDALIQAAHSDDWWVAWTSDEALMKIRGTK